ASGRIEAAVHALIPRIAAAGSELQTRDPGAQVVRALCVQRHAPLPAARAGLSRASEGRVAEYGGSRLGETGLLVLEIEAADDPAQRDLQGFALQLQFFAELVTLVGNQRALRGIGQRKDGHIDILLR